jgi:hypothetical protein
MTDVINANNYGRPLKTLKGPTSFEYIRKLWTKEPETFRRNPRHKMPGPNR